MSVKRRTFTADQKTKIVFETIRGEKETNQLAVEYSLQPNQIRNWKKEFLEKASTVFDSTRNEKALEALEELQNENDELAKKLGRLTVQVDWFKKNLRNALGLTTKIDLLRSLRTSKDSKIPVKEAAQLLDVNRTSIYYKGHLMSDLELAIMDQLDQMHTENPAWGSRQLTSQLNAKGYKIGRYKVKRFMRKMHIEAIYPKPNLSKPIPGHKIYPYILKNKVINQPSLHRLP